MKVFEQGKNISKITDDLGGYGIFGVEFFVLKMMLFLVNLVPDHMIQGWLQCLRKI